VLSDAHRDALACSGIGVEQASRRGYETIADKKQLRSLNITPAGCRVPGLLIPLLDVRGSTWGFQYRPDSPRTMATGRTVKYESPSDQRNGLDIPVGVGPQLADPTIPLWITEGSKKADSAAAHGLCCVALLGVWSWRGTNTAGGKTALADWCDVALNGRRCIMAYDGDVQRNPAVRGALDALSKYLAIKGARIEFLHLPDDDRAGKTGLDDYLVAHDLAELWTLVRPIAPVVRLKKPEAPQQLELPLIFPPPSQPVPLADAHATFRRWLGDDYDADTLTAMLATVAVERLTGDPVWLLVVSGSGNAKTETVQALDGVGATVTSTLTSDAALLSASPDRERTRDATGGLLRKIGNRGVLVVKDVTSILTMDRNLRGRVLAALREVYDGRWYREVGTDGGHTIAWTGRIAVVGAVTTAWDTAHTVIATMGDRFVLIRADSTTARRAAGRQAIRNTGDEVAMRAELAAAAAGVIAGMYPDPIAVTDDEIEILLAAADLVTLARTGVEYDYRGDVVMAHAPEMPTRFGKQLAQIMRGGVAIGMDRADAMRLAIRCARDSMPPLRLAIVDDLAMYPHSTTSEVRKRIGQPRTTVDRQLQSLHALGALVCDEVPIGPERTYWYYSLAENINPTALVVPIKLLTTPIPVKESDRDESDVALSPDLLTHRTGTSDDATQNGSETAFAAVMAVFPGTRVISDEIADDGLF
jgi:Domain of unknown function (DUF3854)